MVTHGKLIFEYNKITDYIYIGTNMCCQVHFNKELLKKGVNADISLERERLDAPFGVDYFLWLPTRDHYPPSSKQLKEGVAALQELVKQKVKTYVHCKRGHTRAPTLVAAYLISTGMSVKEAVDFIKKKRPVIHLSKRQIAALKRFK